MSSPGNIPEFLYHTTVTVINNHAASGGSQQAVYVLGTHANLEAAKSFALTALPRINYQPDDFVAYNVHRAGEPWTYGDGVLVSATAPAGQTFIVRIDTKTNNEKLAAAADGTVVLPAGANHLHYVLQTTVDYNKDRSGDCQNTEIEGCFAHKHDAVLAAKKLLSDQKGDFLLYEERSDLAQAHEVSSLSFPCFNWSLGGV